MNRGQECVKMMCQGNIFYIYTSTNRSPVTIFYVPNTPDNLGSFYWCRVGELVRHEQCKFPLSILTDVMIGKQTASFQRPHASNTRSEQCMSLVSSLLTLDIEAVSDQVITDWVDGLTYILSVEGSKDLVDEPTSGQNSPTPSSQNSSPQSNRGPPPPPGAGGNKRRFTVHASGQDNDAQSALHAAAAAAAASAAAIDDQDDGETITGANNLTAVVGQDDPQMLTAKQQARVLQSDDGLTALQRGGIVVHYRNNKPPQLLYICHHTRPTEQLLGSLCTVAIVPLNNSTNNPTLTFSGQDARTLSTYLNQDSIHLLRSIATGDVMKSKAIVEELQHLTNNTLSIIHNTMPAPPQLPNSLNTSFNGAIPNSASASSQSTTVSLDTMSDLFLGSTHQDFLQAKHCDPASTTTIITDIGPFSFETADKYVLNIWISELQNLLNASGTDVVAADDDFQQFQQQQVSVPEESASPPSSSNNRNRRFTVTRSEMPSSMGMPFGSQNQAKSATASNANDGEIDPLDIAFRGTGLEFVQFPGAIPCMLTWTGPNSNPQQLIITDKFKKTLIDSASLVDLSQIAQGSAHTSVLATCGNPSLALSLTFKSPVTGGNNTWNLTAANVETFNAFACGVNQFLFGLNRSLQCTQHTPSRIFTTQNKLLPYQQQWKNNKISSLMMAMTINDSSTDDYQFQADLPSLVSMLTQGRIFTGFAERDQDVVMNKLTLFFMSPQELLSIAQMDPKKAQDPTRAAKLKTNVGAINPNTKGRLCWCAAGRRVPMSDSYLEIDEITDIFVGRQTKVLAEHAEMFGRDRCFTIMASRDQLDLVADNSLQLLSWMRALHSLCGMTTTSDAKGKGLQEVAVDNNDDRLAQGTRGKRFSVSGALGGAPNQPTGAAPNNFGPDGKPKKRLSLLVSNAPAGQQKPAATTNPQDPRLVLGRGCRFLRYFTSHGQPQTQQVWVYHTSSSDTADRSKRAGSLRWIPVHILAETLGMSSQDPNPHLDKIGPTQWLSQIDRMMQTMSLIQLEETIKVVHTFSKDLFGAWGVLRLAHITDVYVGRTTSSLKTLVPPERHLECFSIVSKDSNKQQSVLSLRADNEQIITTWLHSIQHLILTGGKKLLPEDVKSDASATAEAPAPSIVTPAGGPPPSQKSGRRFTVSSGDNNDAAAAAAAAAATGEPNDEQNDPHQQPQPQPNKQRRLTVKSNQAPPPIAPSILQQIQPDVSAPDNKPKGRRFTVTKTQADIAAAAAAGGDLISTSISSSPSNERPTGPPPLPSSLAKPTPPPLALLDTKPPPLVVAEPSPEPAKQLMPSVAPEIWAKLITNEGVQALLTGIEVVVYTQPTDEALCQYTSVTQQSSTNKDIGVVIHGSQRIHAKKCLLYFSPNGGKSGSVFLHPINPDSTMSPSEYQQSVSVYEYNKYSNELCVECLPVHTLTDITIGKSDQLWKLVTSADSKPLDPTNPSNVLSSSSSCLSLTSKFKPQMTQGEKASKVKKQLHLSTKHKSIVHSLVQALQYIIAQTGKKVLYDQQDKKEPATPTNAVATGAVAPTVTSPPPLITPTVNPTATITPPQPAQPPAQTFHEIANLLHGYRFTQHVRAGVSVRKFDIIISLHKSTQVMFSSLSTNQDPGKSNLARTHELAPTIRSFDLHSPSTTGSGPAMPNVSPVTAQDVTWRGLVESSGLGFFCIKDVTKDSKIWLPLGALTDVYLGQSANVPTNARTPQSMYTLSFSLTGGSSYHLILSAENEDEGKDWLLKQINGGDSSSSDPSPAAADTPAPTVEQAVVEADTPVLPSTGDPQMDEIVAYMSKKHLMFVYALVQGRLCRLRSYAWYDPALHAILWCTTDMNVRGPMYACPIAAHNDTPSTSPLPPPRLNNSICSCTAKCKRPPYNLLHLSAVNEVFVGRVESLLRESISDTVLSQLKIDEDSCATISADRLDVQGQPLPQTPDYEGYNIPVYFNLEASSANYLEEWLNGLQHLLQLRGANVIYS